MPERQPSVQETLDRILSSELFKTKERICIFLSYVVQKELDGKSSEISGKAIAQDVYNRDLGEGSDPENVVRVEANRLRKMLTAYYADEGQNDPLEISIPKGGYVPKYRARPTKSKWPLFVSDWRFSVLAAFVFAGAAVSTLLLLNSQSTKVNEINLETPARIAERQALLDKSPSTLQAVNMAEQARHMLFPIFDKRRQKLTLQIFQQVIALDPQYAGGYAGAAQSLGTLAILSAGEERTKHISDATVMVDKANEIAPVDAWTQSAMGWVALADRRYNDAVTYSRRARELDNSAAEILEFLGTVELFSGNFSEAIAAVSVPQPNLTQGFRTANRNIYAASNYHLGNYETSLDAFREAATYGDPISAPSIAYQIANLHALGEEAEAKKLLQHLTEKWPTQRFDLMLKSIHNDSKHVDELIGRLVQLGWQPAELEAQAD